MRMERNRGGPVVSLHSICWTLGQEKRCKKMADRRKITSEKAGKLYRLFSWPILVDASDVP
jgi:hypothetical protein